MTVNIIVVAVAVTVAGRGRGRGRDRGRGHRQYCVENRKKIVLTKHERQQPPKVPASLHGRFFEV